MAGFFEMLYEGLPHAKIFYIRNFSADMHSADAYASIGIAMLLSSFIMEALYYYVLSNYKNWYKTRNWLLWLVTIGIINFVIAILAAKSAVGGNNYGFSYYLRFAMVNLFWALVFSFIFSMILKFKSTTASRTPF
jgi:hypothetical protein